MGVIIFVCLLLVFTFFGSPGIPGVNRKVS